MILADCGKTINGQSPNPRSLNAWLSANNGYSSASLVWSSLSNFGLTYVGKVSSDASIKSYFDNGKAVILNVNNGGHWVLMTGYSGNNYEVNDPGYPRTSYSTNEVINSAVYTRPAGCSTNHLNGQEFFL